MGRTLSSRFRFPRPQVSYEAVRASEKYSKFDQHIATPRRILERISTVSPTRLPCGGTAFAPFRPLMNFSALSRPAAVLACGDENAVIVPTIRNAATVGPPGRATENQPPRSLRPRHRSRPSPSRPERYESPRGRNRASRFFQIPGSPQTAGTSL